MKNNKLLIIVFLILGFFITVLTDLSAQNTVQIIIDDMTLPPDAPLHGTEGMSWGTGLASPQPMPCPAKNINGDWFQAMTGWGQVYIPREGSLATNTRCQIRNVVTKILHADGTWEQVQSGNPAGAAFVENFAGNASIDAGARDESANGGGVSVIVGTGPWAGYNFHFWPSAGRAAIDTNNIIAVFTTCEARLILDDINKPDDRYICRNILQMGGDWWLNLTIGWLPDWSANSGIGNGRAKWVTSDWQSFNMCTLTPDQVIANPPIAASSVPAANELSAGKILAYPNPLRVDNLYIKSNDQELAADIFIYSITGNLVYKGRLNRAEIIEIPKSTLNCGIFLIKISAKDYLKTEILIVE
jgi:hypothetical protein